MVRARMHEDEPDDADEDTWRRARGLVVSGGVIALGYYRETNLAMVQVARRGITAVLDEIG